MKRLDTDIRVYVSFFGHAKRKKLQRRAGHEGIVSLWELWAWASVHRPNGDLTGMTNEDIALSTNWTGEPDALVDALIQSKLIDGTPGHYQIHDYEEEQPHIQNRKMAQELGKIGGLKAAANMTPEERRERAKHAAESRYSANAPKQTLSSPLEDSKQNAKGPSKPCPVLSCPDLSRPEQQLKQEIEEINSCREPEGSPTTKSKSKTSVQTLFDLWRQVMDHPNAQLGPKRQRRIEWALKNYGLERSQKAIIGCASSPFHMGDNKDGKRFDDLELIFRNEEKFEAFETQGQKATVHVDAETGARKVMVAKSVTDVRTMTIEQESAMYAAMLEKKRSGKPSGVVIENRYAPCQFPEYQEAKQP